MNHNFKLIALDIDGTLITSHYTITRRTRKALRDAMDAGMRVTIATGRFYHSARHIARSIGINAPLVCNDGALIKDISTGKTVFFKPLPMDTARDVLHVAAKYSSFKVQIFMEDYKIYAGRGYRSMQFGRFLKLSSRYSIQGCCNYLRDFVFVPAKDAGDIAGAEKMMTQPPAKIVIYAEPGELEIFKRDIKEKFGDGIFLTTAIKNTVDILNGEVSKARGIAVLAEMLGIRRQEIIAIGDNINDMPMLEYAGLGVAMGNGPDVVKRKADFVTATNDDDGIALFIEKLLKKQEGRGDSIILSVKGLSHGGPSV
ncbi:MAG: Cof-type HAD-IIB family hydrolase [Tepidanaerobacteraceae bacterium]|jgi:Cof subfamily protein (haloacid dehalogenase superfamily)|nr:Cof-type HAD-IIB family hydrolase [Tepidanaerobacteraceae bacterium]